MPDESIHGYLIRVLITLGIANKPSDIKGIISRSGVVRSLLQLHSHGDYIMDLISIDDLDKLIIKHSTMKFRHIYYEDYIRYIFLQDDFYVDSFLFKNDNRRTQLRYCPECFKLQIKEYGLSWFKLDWLTTERCNIHNRRLCHVYECGTPCCNKGTNILNYIKSAMSGTCELCGASNWSFALPLFIDSHPNSYHFL